MNTSLVLLIGLFCIVFILTVVVTRLVLGWLRHQQILDHPNERSSHSLPTPRGGGLAVTPICLLAWGGLWLSDATPPGLLVPLLAAFGLLVLSWFDDKGGLTARLRFGLHLAAVIAGLAALPGDLLIFQGWLPLWADRLIAGLGWVWFLNLYNFMDGIDGITGVESASLGLGLTLLVVLPGLTLLPATLAAPALVLAAAALGFLVWNWHPAKLFLGDSGSIPLGYLGGWLLIMVAGQGYLAAALILPLYYLADASITITRRALRREKIWQAHRQHFYQQAVRGGLRHNQASSLIALTNLGLIVCALASTRAPWLALTAAVILVTLLLTLFARIGRKEATT